MGCSPWGRKEPDTTEHTRIHTPGPKTLGSSQAMTLDADLHWEGHVSLLSSSPSLPWPQGFFFFFYRGNTFINYRMFPILVSKEI